MTSNNGNKAPDPDLVRSCNWSGSIPVILTLAPTSLGTTMMPPPIHVLLNRGTFLHIGLRTAILRLHKFAPMMFSSSNGFLTRNEPEPQGSHDAEDHPNNTADTSNSNVNTTANASNNSSSNSGDTSELPVCWLEDEETQIPLRWHLFAGVLFDMMKTPCKKQQSDTVSAAIPWKIRLHFSNYPSSELLPIEPGQASQINSFKNALKQALFLQYGNAKVAMNMPKQIHQRLCDAIFVQHNYKLYQQINADLQSSGEVQLLPIRLLVDAKPPIQKPWKEKDDNGSETTLGSLLTSWLPDLYEISDNKKDVIPKFDSCRHVIAGIVPPLSVSMRELWYNLCHPDHFLYVVVLTR